MPFVIRYEDGRYQGGRYGQWYKPLVHDINKARLFSAAGYAKQSIGRSKLKYEILPVTIQLEFRSKE